MSDNEALDSFFDKWRARWPEWGVAQVFVPVSQRETVLAFAVLVQELTDAAWGGSDRRPGEAKLGWWMEELQGWTRGARRHPLGHVLQRQRAAWLALAQAVPGHLESRERPLDSSQAQAQLEEMAKAVAAIDAVLYPASATPTDVVTETAAQAALTSLVHLRLAHHGGEAVPLQFLAHGEQGASATWARELATRRAPGREVPRPRRILAGLALARLRRADALRPLATPSALLTAWRAARG